MKNRCFSQTTDVKKPNEIPVVDGKVSFLYLVNGGVQHEGNHSCHCCKYCPHMRHCHPHLHTPARKKGNVNQQKYLHNDKQWLKGNQNTHSPRLRKTGDLSALIWRKHWHTRENTKNMVEILRFCRVLATILHHNII